MIKLTLEDIVIPYCEDCKWELYYQKVKLCNKCSQKLTLSGQEIKNLYKQFENTNGGHLYGEIDCIILNENCYERVDDNKYYKLITLVGGDGGYMVFPFESVENGSYFETV